MVGTVKVAELVTGVEIEFSCHMGLEGYDLIQAGKVGTFIDEIVTYSELD